jgi:hypothetical protein
VSLRLGSVRARFEDHPWRWRDRLGSDEIVARGDGRVRSAVYWWYRLSSREVDVETELRAGSRAGLVLSENRRVERLTEVDLGSGHVSVSWRWCGRVPLRRARRRRRWRQPHGVDDCCEVM